MKVSGNRMSIETPCTADAFFMTVPMKAKIQETAKLQTITRSVAADHAERVGSPAHRDADDEGDDGGDQVPDHVGEQCAGQRTDPGDGQRPESVEDTFVHVFAKLGAGDDAGDDDRLDEDAGDDDRKVVGTLPASAPPKM